MTCSESRGDTACSSGESGTSSPATTPGCPAGAIPLLLHHIPREGSRGTWGQLWGVQEPKCHHEQGRVTLGSDAAQAPAPTLQPAPGQELPFLLQRRTRGRVASPAWGTKHPVLH